MHLSILTYVFIVLVITNLKGHNKKGTNYRPLISY